MRDGGTYEARSPLVQPESWDLRTSVGRALDDLLHKRPAAPVNFSLDNHVAITSVLHHYVFNERYRSLRIPIVFSDGSKPPEFPVGCLSKGDPPEPDDKEMLRLGLMSFRHPDLDYLVDLYITRNRELAAGTATAEAEHVAYHRTVQLLSHPELRNGGDLAILQTGFQPMVVGFYRGVVRVLRGRRDARLARTLFIRSYIYSPQTGESEEPDKPTRYSPDSLGASFENYRRLCTWW